MLSAVAKVVTSSLAITYLSFLLGGLSIWYDLGSPSGGNNFFIGWIANTENKGQGGR